MKAFLSSSVHSSVKCWTRCDLNCVDESYLFFVKKSVMLMLVNGESKEQSTDMSILQASKLMGIHKRNLYLAKQHLTMASESNGLFPASACHRHDARRTHITQTVKDVVF